MTVALGKFVLGLLGLAAVFGLGVAVLSGSEEPDTVHVARAAEASTLPVEAPTTVVPAVVVPDPRADVDRRHRELMAMPAPTPEASSGPRQAVEESYPGQEYARNVAESPECGADEVRAEDGSCVPESFHDRPAERDTSSGSSSSGSSRESGCSGGETFAEDGSCVRAGFYDRTDYNRNGVTDQDEGWGTSPDPDEVKAGS